LQQSRSLKGEGYMFGANMKIYSEIILLLLVMNPLGNIPVFLSTLKSIDPKRHNRIIMREILIAFIALAIFMFFGQYLLKGMQISEQALGIAGGIILFLIALRMIFPEELSKPEKAVAGEPFIVPLAIPMIAGPAAMATAALIVMQYPGQLLAASVVLVGATVIFSIILLGARYLSKVLGDKGLIALERLTGMMLIAMSVQMFLSGIENYFRLH